MQKGIIYHTTLEIPLIHVNESLGIDGLPNLLEFLFIQFI